MVGSHAGFGKRYSSPQGDGATVSIPTDVVGAVVVGAAVVGEVVVGEAVDGAAVVGAGVVGAAVVGATVVGATVAGVHGSYIQTRTRIEEIFGGGCVHLGRMLRDEFQRVDIWRRHVLEIKLSLFGIALRRRFTNLPWLETDGTRISFPLRFGFP